MKATLIYSRCVLIGFLWKGSCSLLSDLGAIREKNSTWLQLSKTTNLFRMACVLLQTVYSLIHLKCRHHAGRGVMKWLGGWFFCPKWICWIVSAGQTGFSQYVQRSGGKKQLPFIYACRMSLRHPLICLRVCLQRRCVWQPPLCQAVSTVK